MMPPLQHLIQTRGKVIIFLPLLSLEPFMPDSLETWHAEQNLHIPESETNVIGMCGGLVDPPDSYQAKPCYMDGIHLNHGGALLLKGHIRNHMRLC